MRLDWISRLEVQEMSDHCAALCVLSCEGLCVYSGDLTLASHIGKHEPGDTGMSILSAERPARRKKVVTLVY